MTSTGCALCGTVGQLTQHDDVGALCQVCAFRQAERDEYGYGLAASTFGFLYEDE